jgi:hypothetical protein
MNAIDLFGGGATVSRKMTHAVRNKLIHKTIVQLHEMEEFFRLPNGTLIDVVLRGGSVDYALFDVIAPAIDLTIHDVLGEPDFSSAGAAAYWKQQMIDSPLQLVGSATSDRIEPRELDIKLYVISRAIEELNAQGELTSVSHT